MQPFKPRDAILTVALCYLVALCEGFDLQAAGVAAPRLVPAFNLAPKILGWFFSSSTFGLMIGAAVGGRLSDRWGRKSVLVASVACFGIMSALTALAPSPAWLLTARFFTGVGIGGALPNLLALTVENTPPGRQHRALGVLYAGLPSGGAVASLTALASPQGWKTVFLAGGAIPLLAIPLLLLALPESAELRSLKAAPARPTDARGFGFALFGEGRALQSLLLWFAFFLALLTMYLLLNWLPTLLIGKGLSKADASLAQLSFNVFGACASVATGVMMDVLAIRKLIAWSFLSAAASLFLLAGVPPQLPLCLLVAGLVGVTMSATQTAMYAISSLSYPTAVRGTGVGTAVSVGRVGSACGPLLAATLIAAGWTPQHVLSLLAPVIVVSGAAVLVLVIALGRRAARAAAPTPGSLYH